MPTKVISSLASGIGGLMLLLAGLVNAQSEPSIQVVPANPRHLEPVQLRTVLKAGTGRFIKAARVSMDGGVIVVDYDGSVDLVGPRGDTFDASLGSFPEGTYT